jgi:peptide/nickel transport system permease protein
MIAYVLRRLLLAVPALLGITFLTYAFLGATGDPCAALLGERYTAERCEVVRERYSLDDPLPIKYGRYLGAVLSGDLGTSVVSKRPVAVELREKMPATMELALSAVLIAVLVGIPLGILAATRHNTLTDLAAMVVALVGVSMPVFWLALMLIYFLAFKAGLFPTTGRLSSGMDLPTITGLNMVDALLGGHWDALKDTLHHLALPAVALSTIPAAFIARITRSAMLEVLGQDYIRTARAKGLVEAVVVRKHALKNALLPVVTVIGLQTGFLLSGAVLTETIFAWPGMGRWVVTAITSNDIPVVQAGVLVFATIFVLINLLVDVSYAWLDPRISFE